tara:strand:- start:16 stop:579 length:564 start_codon:yes stop_codon:yes gene_type:complete
MIDILLATILASESSLVATACPVNEERQTGHLFSVCDPILEGGRAYSVTFEASLSPEPAAQQVALYKRSGLFFLRIAGFRWESGSSLVTTRRNEIAISKEDALSLVDLFDDARLKRLSQLSYYGDPLIVCSDGAETEVATASDGRTQSFAQHTCAAKSELNEVASVFREVALKYDPGFEGMLTGLRH